MEDERSDFFVKLWGFCFFKYKFLNKFRKNDSKYVSLPGKIINVFQSFSFLLYEIIIDSLFNDS